MELAEIFNYIFIGASHVVIWILVGAGLGIVAFMVLAGLFGVGFRHLHSRGRYIVLRMLLLGVGACYLYYGKFYMF